MEDAAFLDYHLQKKKKVLRWTQVVPSIPSVDPGPLYGEKSLLCSDFV